MIVIKEMSSNYRSAAGERGIALPYCNRCVDFSDPGLETVHELLTAV